MTTRINYMLKVNDAKLGAVKKALTAADIDVVSIVEVFKEEQPEATPEDAASNDAQGPAAG